MLETAKISCLGPNNGFFRKIFGNITEQEDLEFDRLCQMVNAQLITCFATAFKKFNESKKKAQVTFSKQLFEYLQSQKFTRLVDSSSVQELRESSWNVGNHTVTLEVAVYKGS